MRKHRTTDDLLARIRGEYLERPGLRLTFRQACRLWGLDENACMAALDALVRVNFLTRRVDGTYVRATEGRPPATRPQMLKAELRAGRETADAAKRLPRRSD
jgi:hypothetical protein